MTPYSEKFCKYDLIATVLVVPYGLTTYISRIDWSNNEQKSVSSNLVLVVPYGLTTYTL